MSIEGFSDRENSEILVSSEQKEINYEIFLENLKTHNSLLENIIKIEKADKILEQKELSIFEQFFNNEIDIKSLTNLLPVSNENNELDELNNSIGNKNYYEISGNIDNLTQKEKIKVYSILSNLAYSEFETINRNESEGKNIENLSISTVKLDGLSFPNINKIFDNPKPLNLSPDEEKLYSYIKNNKDNIELVDNNSLIIGDDIKDILKFTSYGNSNTYADLGEKHINIDNNIIPSKYIDNNINIEGLNKSLLVSNGLEEIRKQKIIENGEILKQLKGEFEILDYFPKTNTESKTGFGAICLKDKTGNKYFAITGTQPTQWGDLKADLSLIFNKVPEKQTKDMIDFVGNNLNQGENFRVVGHSLGGALSQILTSMYSDSVGETYTFNSPGAKDLKSNISENDPYFAKIKDFLYNKDKEQVQELVTNVVGGSGLSLISNLGEDIGNYEIKLKGLSSHSILEVIKYIDMLDENSEELVRIHRLNDVREINNDKNI